MALKDFHVAATTRLLEMEKPESFLLKILGASVGTLPDLRRVGPLELI